RRGSGRREETRDGPHRRERQGPARETEDRQSVISLLLAGFIIYLYTPHLLFKAAAATRYDFVDRKGLPQIEEFFSAALPSFFLNLKTLILINVTTLIVNHSFFGIDRAEVSKI